MKEVHGPVSHYDVFNITYKAMSMTPIRITNHSLLTVSKNSFMIKYYCVIAYQLFRQKYAYGLLKMKILEY
jgi:hypothetical protein